jgi:hypothetical protein
VPTRWRIVLLATLFNLAFELAFRGAAGMVATPGLPIGLALIYISYFTIVEHLIRRYDVANLDLLLIAFAFGLLPIAFLTGIVFAPPLAAGVNWRVLLGVNVVWWGFTQGLLTLYFARRVSGRDWKEPSFARGTLAAAVVFLVLAHAGRFASAENLPRGAASGYLVIFVLFGIAVAALRARLRLRTSGDSFVRSRFLDVLAGATLAVFVGVGLFVAREAAFDPATASVLDARAVSVARGWTQFVFFAMLAYYARYRQRISI